MKFRDMTNPNDEMLCGVNVSHSGGGCCLSWTYPFRYKKICVFEIPLDSGFNEAAAEKGEYTRHILAHPDSSITTQQPCNFAVFCVDDDDFLVRQPETLFECPINITYEIVTEEDVQIIKGRFGITKKKLVKTKKYLELSSSISISGRRILYRVNRGIFCLPCDLPANKKVRLRINGELERFDDGKVIRVTKQKG